MKLPLQLAALKLSAAQAEKSKRLVEIQDDKAQKQFVVSFIFAGITALWLSGFNPISGV